MALPKHREAALHPHAGLPRTLRTDGVPQTHRQPKGAYGIFFK